MNLSFPESSHELLYVEVNKKEWWVKFPRFSNKNLPPFPECRWFNCTSDIAYASPATPDWQMNVQHLLIAEKCFERPKLPWKLYVSVNTQSRLNIRTIGPYNRNWMNHLRPRTYLLHYNFSSESHNCFIHASKPFNGKFYLLKLLLVRVTIIAKFKIERISLELSVKRE